MLRSISRCRPRCPLVMLIWLIIPIVACADPYVPSTLSLRIAEGGAFTPLDLDALVDDPDYADADLAWRIQETGDVPSAVVGHRAYFAAPDTDWFGSGRVRLKVCNPSGSCATCDVLLEVAAVNDPPAVDFPDQVAVRQGQPFDPLVLSQFATDIDDDPASMTWSVEGGYQLTAEIVDGTLYVRAADERWTGAEDLTIRGCDATGACAQSVVQFAIADADALTLRLIDNAGFQLRWRDIAILIDAVYRDPAARFPDLVTGVPPFDANLLLFTHSHPDHFDAETVAAYMVAQPNVQLVAPMDAVLRVLAIDPSLEARSTGVTLGRNGSLSLERCGIPLTLYDFPHGGTPNAAYRIQLGTHVVFHSGDVLWDQLEVCRLLQLYGLPDAGVTVALLVPRFFSSVQFRAAMREHIAARFYIPIHVKPGSFSYYYDLAARETDLLIIDELLETWVLPSAR
jgi:L-ascorbate metabolism protein UlaG (beta-lactamase superfamily)